MAGFTGKVFGSAPLFDPSIGLSVREPSGTGRGWWAGAPSTAFDPSSDSFYLSYRLRQPPELGRGIECRIAASSNGIAFQDIWAMPRSSLKALSIERGSLLKGLDGRWQLYISFANETDGKWRIGRLEADEPDQFDMSSFETLLTPEQAGCEGVKDPCVFLVGRMVYMLYSYATAEEGLTPEQQREKHRTGDIYNTGLTLSRTAAAISGDGRTFQLLGDVSPIPAGACFPASHVPAAEWDRYCRRIGALLPLENGGYLAFYDGSSGVQENYEEKCGLAFSFDLRSFHSLSPQVPALCSPHASGSLRYVDALPVGREIFYYYEMARPDGSHELRVSVVER